MFFKGYRTFLELEKVLVFENILPHCRLKSGLWGKGLNEAEVNGF